MKNGQVTFQSPEAAHAKLISQMVRESAELDNNSEYIYALWCTYFSRSSAIAIRDQQLYGFVTGFRCPSAPEVYFLWQTATKRRHGVANLGLDLIQFAVEREIASGARFVEASMDSSNAPIVFLMRALSKRLGGTLTTAVLFTSDMLSTLSSKHHEEVLYRIEL